MAVHSASESIFISDKCVTFNEQMFEFEENFNKTFVDDVLK